MSNFGTTRNQRDPNERARRTERAYMNRCKNMGAVYLTPEQRAKKGAAS